MENLIFEPVEKCLTCKDLRDHVDFYTCNIFTSSKDCTREDITGSPAIGVFSSLTPNEKKEYLKKRSQKHFKEVIANELRDKARKI
jgi:hypothetical protein